MRNWKQVLSVVALATLVSPLAMASPASGPVRLHAGKKAAVHATGRKVAGAVTRATGKRVRKSKSSGGRLAKAPKRMKKTKGRVRRVKTAHRARKPRSEAAPQTPELSRA